MMPKDKKQSEKMERLISSVKDQPPQRERLGPINQTLPTPSFEWKIPNIQQVLLRAEGFYSEPFYLFRVDYKYSLKIQAEKIGFQFLQVCIKVVPGEFDALLSWPCKEKLRVTLVNQNPLKTKRENISQVIDFEKKPFSRPLYNDHQEYRLILSIHAGDFKSQLYRFDPILIRVNRD